MIQRKADNDEAIPKSDAVPIIASPFVVAEVADAEVVVLEGAARTPPWTLFEAGRVVLLALEAPDLYISRVLLVELFDVSNCSLHPLA